MDVLKTEFNIYFVYLVENHTTSHVFVQILCVDLGPDKDEDMWKSVYFSWVICDDSDIKFMFRSMIENNVFVPTAASQTVIRDLMVVFGNTNKLAYSLLDKLISLF